VLEYLQPLQKPVLLWPQERSLAGAGVMQEGDWSVRLGLNGIPAAAEVTAVASVLELVRAIGTPVHLMRLTQSRSLDLVQQAQQTGVPVTASTTWMHLLLTDADIERWPYHPSLHLHAPLGTAADRQALLAGVTAGIVGAIASDHTPYTFEEKTVAFEEAPPGAIGLELALPLLWQELVGKRTLDALTLWSALSNRPAQYLNCPMPELQTGAAANLVMFAPDRSWTVSHQTLHSLSQATPWLGRTLNGKVLGCWLGGQWLSGERLVVPA
jgi:dihydroorotase